MFCFVTAKKLSSNLESLHFLIFSQNVANAKSGREMVIENREIVMGKCFAKHVGTLLYHIDQNLYCLSLKLDS